ncbi:unnamed protein product [Rotaria sp. Silwood1]|nr:unnamed protein product [Rotaria sp. Silwood1]
MSTFILSKTQRSKPLLLCNGLNYTIDKTTDDKIYWKYEFARTLKCKGRVHTNSLNTIISHETNNHNHLGNAVSSEIRIFEEKIRDRTINYNESTQTIIDNCLTNLSDSTVLFCIYFGLFFFVSILLVSIQ